MDLVRRAAAALVLLVSALSPAAGGDFVRIACVPEARYFSVEHRYLESEDDLDEPSPTERKAQAEAWRRAGFHELAGLDFECRLPESTYRVTTRNPQSRPGAAACNLAVTLKWHDEVWLDRVHLGPACGGDRYLESFEIWDSRRAERQPGSMTLCMLAPGDVQGGRLCEEFVPHPTQSHVQVVTQTDLEEYLAARAGSATASGGWQRDARNLNKFLFVRFPCGFQGLQLPGDAVIHVLINGRTRKLPFGIAPADSRAYVGDVYVNLPGKRVALVMVGNSGPTVWNFHWTRGTEIVAVAAMASSTLHFAGLPEGVPVFSGHFGGGTACKYFSASPGFPEREKREVAAFVERMYQRPADATAHFQFRAHASAGELLPPAQYVQSAEVTVESFATAASELIGPKGLEKLEAEGAIRKATSQDAEAWLAAWKAAHPGRRFAAPDKELLNHVNLWMAYVVQKPFRYPTGLFGGDQAAFFVPKGAARPTGELGHSVIYDLNGGVCFATRQSRCEPFN